MLKQCYKMGKVTTKCLYIYIRIWKMNCQGDVKLGGKNENINQCQIKTSKNCYHAQCCTQLHNWNFCILLCDYYNEHHLQPHASMLW
jgi:hypothetical protein